MCVIVLNELSAWRLRLIGASRATGSLSPGVPSRGGLVGDSSESLQHRAPQASRTSGGTTHAARSFVQPRPPCAAPEPEEEAGPVGTKQDHLDPNARIPAARWPGEDRQEG